MILESIVNKSPIVKGWSGDQKYCAVTADGTKYLLRVSPMWRSTFHVTKERIWERTG